MTSFLGRLFGNINAATLSGAIDIIVVEQEDGTLVSTPFHVRFGKLRLIRSSDKVISLSVNDKPLPLKMKLGSAGEAYFVHDSSKPVPWYMASSPLPSPPSSPPQERKRRRAASELPNYNHSEPMEPLTHQLEALLLAEEEEKERDLGKALPSNRMDGEGRRGGMRDGQRTTSEKRYHTRTRPLRIGRQQSLDGGLVGGGIKSKSFSAFSDDPPPSGLVLDSTSDTDGESDNTNRNSKNNINAGRSDKGTPASSASADNTLTLDSRLSKSDLIPILRCKSDGTMTLTDDELSVLDPIGPGRSSKEAGAVAPSSSVPDGPNAKTWSWGWGSLPTNWKRPTSPKGEEDVDVEELKRELAAASTRTVRKGGEPNDEPDVAVAEDEIIESLVDTAAKRGWLHKMGSMFRVFKSGESTQPEFLVSSTPVKSPTPSQEMDESMTYEEWAGLLEELAHKQANDGDDVYDDDDGDSYLNDAGLVDIRQRVGSPLAADDIFHFEDELDGNRPMIDDSDDDDYIYDDDDDFRLSASAPPISPHKEMSIKSRSEVEKGGDGGGGGSMFLSEADMMRFDDIVSRYLATEGNGIELSRCAHLLLSPTNSASDDEARRRIFRDHQVSFEEFSMDAVGVLADPNLVVNVASRIVPWSMASPLIVSAIALRRIQIPETLAASVDDDVALLNSLLIPAQQLTAEQITAGQDGALAPLPAQQGGWRAWIPGWTSPVKTATPVRSTSTSPLTSPVAIRRSVSDDHQFAAVTLSESAPVLSHHLRPASTSRIHNVTTPVLTRSDAEEARAHRSSEASDLAPVAQHYAKKSLRPSSQQLKSFHLKPGQNRITFYVKAERGVQQVTSQIYLWSSSDRIVISDIDGTITRSDVFGQIMPYLGKDWSHSGVVNLYTSIRNNGFRILYLTSRPIGQAGVTRGYVGNLKQDGISLPEGPVFMSPDRLFESFRREIIHRKPEEFKIACLKDIRKVFPAHRRPFYAGFGNRITDYLSYRAVGVPAGKVYIIDPSGEITLVSNQGYRKSYTSLNQLVQEMFPYAETNEEQVEEAYNDFNYWKPPLPELVLSD
eukprot:TRINITY_DN2349_c0_g1_i1.p1 TRINITY_DN2349_c0_g1~~TRINITY_DN2349_c0_g1_i1.p1  ORF type:complete len:1063 (+),score=241.93 TRINITY_DN2349_c0_g1_i1:157-3345(+)